MKSRLRLLFSVAVGALLCMPLLPVCGADDAVKVSVVTDRPEALYACGEEARFLVTVTDEGGAVTAGSVECTLTLDGGNKLATLTGELGPQATEITGELQEPGVLLCTAVYTDGGKRHVGSAGAAYDPYQIQPSAPEPADFDRFWDRAKNRLARVAMDPILEKSEQHSTPDVSVYKISLGNIAGSRVYGWFGLPNRAGKFPAILTVPYAGVYPTPANWTDWARRGFIAMGISAHDYDCDLPKETYEELNGGAIRGYPFRGRESANSYYFMRVFLSCVRSIDYLTSRPEWDGETLIVTGSSQGGGLSIVSAGLDQRVTGIAANVPALCDHTGAMVGRQAGWPRLIPSGDELAVERVTRVSQYYDAVNFARRIKCPTIMAVGLVDRTCPPSGIFAAFNQIQGPKQMEITPLMGHSQSAEYGLLRDRWIPQQAFGPGPALQMR